ncbi:MAG: helix-turn-helix transcriptional regulator, partial [Clostridia bacterium]|nr:helix-turn-helix transcriptional regulator [Clostridia bacterium]
CGMSYSYFAKNFKQLYGKSCKEYIEFIKICKADDMLLFTDFNLDYISQETGFTDCSHFIKTYKKLKGITPKQRRLSYHKQAKTT